MRICFYYRWIEFDIDKFNHHKLVGWKRVGFKKREHDGYDEYILIRSLDFDWKHTESFIEVALEVLRQIYGCVSFINDYDFGVVKNFANGFGEAETYIRRLSSAFVQGGWSGNHAPDLVFVSRITSNNGLNSCNIDGRDILKITIEDMVNPVQETYRKPVIYENKYICPICKHQVWKNYDGCCNCKQLIDWTGIQ